MCVPRAADCDDKIAEGCQPVYFVWLILLGASRWRLPPIYSDLPSPTFTSGSGLVPFESHVSRLGRGGEDGAGRGGLGRKAQY